MGETLTKIFATILIVVLLFIFPLLDSFERMDNLSYMIVYESTVKFVDTVRNNGCISQKMYQDFCEKLASTGNKYDIEMIHRKSIYNEDEDALVSSYTQIYDEIYTEGILRKGYYANFEVNDYFYVSVKNITSTPATLIKNMLYGRISNKYSIIFSYGGMIKNIDTNYIVNQGLLNSLLY